MLSLCINLIIRKLDDSLKLKTNHEKKCETIEFINENGEFVLRSDKCFGTLRESTKKFSELPLFVIANIDGEEITPADIPAFLNANTIK